MFPDKNVGERKVHLHCNVHHLALLVSEKAISLVSTGVAAIPCPGIEGQDSGHEIEVDEEYIPFRVTLIRPETAQEGSGAAPSRSRT